MKLPRNLPGLVGLALFGAAWVSFAFLMFVELARGDSDPYVGLFHYIILPAVGLLGLLLLAAGAWLEKPGRTGRIALWARGLVSTRAQQSALLVSGAIGAVVVFLMSLGGVRAIEYTESASFCGDVCHTVMAPEYIAWESSPHAQIACVECHVGSGATSYVQAKARGVGQVVSVLTDSYPRPIPTPIHMRDTEVICESCHWPARDIGDKPIRREYHLTEGFEDPWVLEMLVRVGGGDRERGFTDGAHWHMNLDNRVEYGTVDDRRQTVAWVRFTDREGAVTEYRNVDLDDPIDGLEGREVDCLTCHNRPAHRFETPVAATNRALQLGTLDGDVPGIRWLALELLAGEYETTSGAMSAIDEGLRAGVEDEDEAWGAANPDRLAAAVEVLQRLFRRNRNPEMRVDWLAYPDNSQHVSEAGCFRCHAGNLVASDGLTISADCNTCHLITGQGRPGIDWRHDPLGMAFVHPSDGEIMDEPILCQECHDGSLGY